MLTIKVTNKKTNKTVTLYVADNAINESSMDNLMAATRLENVEATENAIIRRLAIKMCEKLNSDEFCITSLSCYDNSEETVATLSYCARSEFKNAKPILVHELALPIDPEIENQYNVNVSQLNYPDLDFFETFPVNQYRENVIARVSNDPEFAMQIGVIFSEDKIKETLLAAKKTELAGVEHIAHDDLAAANEAIDANINKLAPTLYQELEDHAVGHYCAQPRQQYEAFVESLAISLHNAAADYFRARWFANLGNRAALEADRIKFNKTFDPLININSNYELSPVDTLIEAFKQTDIKGLDKAVSTLLDKSYTKDKPDAFSFLESELNKLNAGNEYFTPVSRLSMISRHENEFKFSANVLRVYMEQANEEDSLDEIIRNANSNLNREINTVSATMRHLQEELIAKAEAERKAREEEARRVEEARRAEQEASKQRAAAAQSTSQAMKEIDNDLQQIDTLDQNRKEDVIVLLEDEPKKPGFWQRHKSKFISIGLGLLIAGGAAAAIVLTAPLWPITLPIIAVGGIAAGVAAAIIGISALIGYVSDKRRNAKYQSGPIPIEQRSSSSTSADDDFGPAAAPVQHSTAAVLSASPRSTEATNPFVSASSAPLVTAPAQSRAISSSYQPALTPNIGSYGNGEQTPKQEFENALAHEFANNYPKDEDTNNPFAVTKGNILDCFRNTCGRDMDKFLQYVKDNYNQDGKGKKIIKAAIKNLLEIYPEFKPSDFHGTILEREYDISHAISTASKGKEEAGPRKK